MAGINTGNSLRNSWQARPVHVHEAPLGLAQTAAKATSWGVHCVGAGHSRRAVCLNSLQLMLAVIGSAEIVYPVHVLHHAFLPSHLPC